MTNEEFLQDKFCISRYGKKEWLEEAKAAYLLKQVDWIEDNLMGLYQGISEAYVVEYLDTGGRKQITTGSCLLEVIENAQKETA